MRDAALREDFRLRALWAAVAVGVAAHVTLRLAKDGAPRVFSGLWSDPAAWILQGSTAAVSVGAIAALWRRRWRLARLLALSEAVLIVWGWALAQFPYLVFPSHSIDDSAAPEATLRPVAVALGVGATLLFPSFYYLLRVFKGAQAFDLTDRQA